MKNIIKLLFFILLTLLVINNTYTIYKKSEIYLNNEIIKKVNELYYRPIELIDANVMIYSTQHRGSGSIIKIGKDYTYILTVAHILYVKRIKAIQSRRNTSIDILSKNMTVISKNKKYKATLVKMDNQLDIAVLKINKKLNIKPVKIAKQEPKFGETVWTISNPGKQKDVLNKGVFSSIDKYQSFISTASFFGSSGGMAVNTKGEQIGVISTIYTTTIDGYFPAITVYNGITRTRDLNKFLKGVL